MEATVGVDIAGKRSEQRKKEAEGRSVLHQRNG
jgi:hypothetical protein